MSDAAWRAAASSALGASSAGGKRSSRVSDLCGLLPAQARARPPISTPDSGPRNTKNAQLAPAAPPSKRPRPPLPPRDWLLNRDEDSHPPYRASFVAARTREQAHKGAQAHCDFCALGGRARARAQRERPRQPCCSCCVGARRRGNQRSSLSGGSRSTACTGAPHLFPEGQPCCCCSSCARHTEGGAAVF